MYDEEQVAAIRGWPIEAAEKGFGGPAHQSPVTAGQLARERPRADAGLLSTPRVVLREEALRHNISAMAAYCAAHGVSLFPHGKTTMAPQILAAQLDAGAGGMTAASVSQARVFRRFGVRNILLANELVDDASISWVASELTAGGPFSFLCYVDSVTGAGRLDAILAARGFTRRLRVLVELGHEDGRTGCRTSAAALAVAAAVARAPRLELAGVAGDEGSLMAPTPEEKAQKARAYCGELGQLALALAASGLFPEPPVMTAGGSAYFDVVVEVLGGQRDWNLILRSGCYVTHDHGLYSSVAPSARNTPGVPVLEPALEAWAPVLSRPEPGTAVLGIGRRDLSFDAGASRRPARARGRRNGPRHRRLGGHAALRSAHGAIRPRRFPARPRRRALPGHLASLHHLRQVAVDPGARCGGPHHRRDPDLLLGTSPG